MKGANKGHDKMSGKPSNQLEPFKMLAVNVSCKKSLERASNSSSRRLYGDGSNAGVLLTRRVPSTASELAGWNGQGSPYGQRATDGPSRAEPRGRAERSRAGCCYQVKGNVDPNGGLFNQKRKREAPFQYAS